MTPSLLTFAQAPASPPFGALTPHVRHFLRNPAGVAGLTLLLLMILMAIFAALLFPGDPLDMVAQPLLRPGQDPQFPLGTDALGRNLLAGLVHGARISLLTGFSAVGISLLIGTLVHLPKPEFPKAMRKVLRTSRFSALGNDMQGLLLSS